nr:LLM class flavin-dependent oxidoreductase [Pseudomonas sp. MWU16-30317]
MIQAGTSPEGRDLSARVADVVFSFARTLGESLELASDVRSRAREYQRNVDEILFMPALNVVIANTLEEAARIEASRSAALSLEKMHEALSRQFNGRDFRHCPLDEPFPVIDGVDASSSGLTQFRDEIEQGRQRGQTLRQVLYSLQTPWLRLVGTPESITGLVDDDYQGVTLREHLGISVPDHRHAGLHPEAPVEAAGAPAVETAREALPG